MAPMPAGSNGRQPRRPKPLRTSPEPQHASTHGGQKTAAANEAVLQAKPGSFATSPAWLSMPPAVVPNYSPHMVHNSDLSATGSTTQGGSEIGSHPPGGFLNYLNQASNYSLPEEIHRQPPMSGNFLYTGNPASYAPFESPLPWMTKAKSLQPQSEQGTTLSEVGSQTSPIVNNDNTNGSGGSASMFSKKDASGNRPGRRMIWTSDETIRLVSAWLKNSNDPIQGNWKRNDQYWGAVTAMFNSTTPSDRTREIKQLKEQWHRVNRTVNAFQGSWMKAQRLRASGESDEQVMDKAMAFYENESEEGQFKLIACWKVLRDQPKWHAYNEDLNGSNKRKNIETDAIDLTSPPDAVTDLPRPIGCKKAKEQLNGKGKGKVSSSIMDEIDKLREGQAKAKEDRIEVLERHQQIAADKKESARLIHLAAQEKKEARLLERETKMHDKESKYLETYKSLLTLDTSQMPEDLRAEHMIALKSMRERIFSNRSSG